MERSFIVKTHTVVFFCLKNGQPVKTVSVFSKLSSFNGVSLFIKDSERQVISNL